MPADDRATPVEGPVRLHLVHATGRRARLRLEAELAREAMVDLANRVASVPGVLHAQLRPNTGSLIVESAQAIEAVLKAVEERGIARIGSLPKPPPVSQVLQLGLLQADMGVKQKTGDALDLRTAIALALLGAAAVQLGRGRVFGPAATLALGALSLIDRAPGSR